MLSSTSTLESTLIETGCVLAMPIRMANCVERTPEACMAASYMRVTARAVRRKFRLAQ